MVAAGFFWLAGLLAVIVGVELLLRGGLAANAGTGAIIAALALFGAGAQAVDINALKGALKPRRDKRDQD
jgi:hypothetical protein